MSLYKVYFKWKEKDVELTARSLDMTHPYFVSIKDLVFTNKGSLIINPSQDDVKKQFGDANHLMIPFQTVTLIEELKEEEPDDGKVMQFTVVDESEDEPSD